jgi:hypothetical protein
VTAFRIPAQTAIDEALSTPSTGKNSGMIGVSIEKAIVITNWMPTIAHSVCCQCAAAPCVSVPAGCTGAVPPSRRAPSGCSSGCGNFVCGIKAYLILRGRAAAARTTHRRVVQGYPSL